MDKTTYKRAFDAIYAPDAAQRAVLHRISPQPRKKLPRMALILCAVLILTCSAAVASGLNGGWLAGVIRLNGGDVPAGNLQEINQTVEKDGLRMTLVSAASDGVHLYLLMDIESLEGHDFSHAESEALPMSESIWVDERLLLEDSGGYGMCVFRVDDGRNPSRAQLAFRFSMDKFRAGQEMELIISSLQHSVMVPYEDTMHRASELIADGEWRFPFRLNEHLETVRYTLDSFDVSVSALGISISGNGCGTRWPGIMNENSLSLRMADGTLSALTSAGYHRTTRNGAVSNETLEATAIELIDPEKVTAIIIDHEEYPLVPAR